MAEPSKINTYTLAGYLGGQNTFYITRYDSNVLHTIKYRCGNVTGTICNLSSSTTVSFVLPVSLASQNTSGTSVTVSFEMECYENGGKISSTSIARRAYQIPEDIKPSCAVSVSDGNGLLAKYGAYVQNKSKLRIITTPTLAYDSPIADYKITVDGVAYNLEDVVTSEIRSAGEIQISATVTDARGRSGSASASISAIDYTQPAVVSFNADRVNADGSDNEQGDHIKVTFSCVVTPLNNKNSAVYKLEYKKSADAFYTEISVSNLNGNYALTDISRIFAADTGSSYDVRLTITDDFHTTVYENKAQSGFTIFHVPASGHGFSFGKVSEIDGLFDVAFLARFGGGFMQPELRSGTDFDNVTVPNTYACADAATAGYLNCPFTSGAFVLDVKSTGVGGVVQCAVLCDADAVTVNYRGFTEGAWGEWVAVGSVDDGLPKKDTLENMSWADIQTVCKAGKASEYWRIGDQKNINFNGETYAVDLIGFDHDVPVDATSYGRSTTGATFQFHNSLSTTYNMNNANTNGSWARSVMKLQHVPTFWSYLDADLQAVIATVQKATATSAYDSSLQITEDTLFILSNEEVFGQRGKGYDDEGTQYAYYAAGNTTQKYIGSSIWEWWLRSPQRDDISYFCCVGAGSGEPSSLTVSTKVGVALAFCV